VYIVLDYCDCIASFRALFLGLKMSSAKRPTLTGSNDETSTPAKKVKVSQDINSTGNNVGVDAGAVAASSPAAGRETDSPSSAAAARGGNHHQPHNGADKSRGGQWGKRGGGGGGFNKGRGGKRGGKSDSRQWGGRTDNAKSGMRQWGPKDTSEAASALNENKQERLPKKKVAVMIGYNGLAYRGSQM
jgi:tRNA pseudouridine38-40 synthase